MSTDQEKPVTTLEKQVDHLEARVAGLKILHGRIREGVSDLIDRVNELVNQKAEATAVRKSLDSDPGDTRSTDPATFRQERAENSLHRAVSDLLANPQRLSRNGHTEEED